MNTTRILGIEAWLLDIGFDLDF